VRGVSYSPALRWFVFVLLPLTLAWKLFVYPDESSRNAPFQTAIADFLVRQHFVVSVGPEQSAVGRPAVLATSGLCRMLIAQSPPEGWARDVTRLHATADDVVFVLYKGKVYQEQPNWLTAYDFLLSKFPRAFGLKEQSSGIFTVVASRSCGAERLPWRELP
jgi:hypothetical protein